jgi:hypothetical protein
VKSEATSFLSGNPVRNISLSAIIFSLLIFSSCQKKNAEQMRRADSLSVKIDSAEKIFFAVDTTRIKNILDSSEHTERLIKEYSPDSLDKQTTIMLADYLRSLKALEEFPAGKKNALFQISLSRKQLADMKHDLEANSMNENDFAKYFPDEQRAVDQLCSYLNMAAYKANLMISQCDYVKGKVDSFVTTLDTLNERKIKNPNFNEEFIDKD